MHINNGKITIKQAIVILILSCSSILVVLLPSILSETAGGVAYIAPVIAFVPLVVLSYVLYSLFKNYKQNSLEDIFKSVLGKFLSKLLIIIYAIWIFLLIALYTKTFGDIFVSTISVNSPVEFFIFAILGVTFIVSRRKIEHFARSTEVFIIILATLFILGFLLIVPNIDIKNFYMPTTNDTFPLLKAVYQILSIGIYFTSIFFLGDKIVEKDKLKKYGIYASIVLVIIDIMIVLMTIGVFGSRLTKQFFVPFFMALKDVKILNVISGIESIFISLWFLSDFTLITLLILIMNKLVKNIFSIKHSRVTITPITFGAHILSLYIANNSIEVMEFIKRIEVHVNLILGFAVPCAILAVGKIKQRYKKASK